MSEPEEAEESYDSGPYCRHWHDPSDCDEVCGACGHECRAHCGRCIEGECNCDGFVDADDVKEKHMPKKKQFVLAIEKSDYGDAIMALQQALNDKDSETKDYNVIVLTHVISESEGMHYLTVVVEEP